MHKGGGFWVLGMDDESNAQDVSTSSSPHRQPCSSGCRGTESQMSKWVRKIARYKTDLLRTILALLAQFTGCLVYLGGKSGLLDGWMD